MAEARRRQATGGFELPLAAAEAISVFTPEGERAWVPGWEPRYPAGRSSEQAGTVFTTKAHGTETVWVIIEIDRAAGRAGYVRITRGVHAGTVRVACVDAGPDRCAVAVSYDLTALDDGDGALDEYRPETFAETMKAWRTAIVAHLAH